MTIPVFARLALSNPTTGIFFEVSSGIAMGNANAAQLWIVAEAFVNSGLDPFMNVLIQKSNDLENWTNATGLTIITAPGSYRATAVTGIATAFIRVKVLASEANFVVAVNATLTRL